MSSFTGSIVGNGAFQSADVHVDAPGQEEKGVGQSTYSFKITFKYNRNIAKSVKLYCTCLKMLWCDVGECVFRQATMCQDVAAECLEPQNIVGRTAPSRNVAADCLGPQKVVTGEFVA